MERGDGREETRILKKTLGKTTDFLCESPSTLAVSSGGNAVRDSIKAVEGRGAGVIDMLSPWRGRRHVERRVGATDEGPAAPAIRCADRKGQQDEGVT